MTFAGFDTARSIAEAVLYEGYLLYPYRKGALKNHLRWTLGGIQPSRTEGEPDRTFAQTECLAQAHDGATLTVRVKFLHLVAARSLGEEAVERELTLGALRLDEVLTERIFPFAFSAEHPEQLPVRGHVAVLAGRLADTLYRVRVRLTNQSGALPGEQASSASSDLARTLLAAHTLLGLRGGSFVSMIDPPAAWSEYASACSNVGTWPVLVGKPAKDVMLSCPIILYDYPEIAAESAGDLFDSTEIDEILTLRILTLADDEKREIRGADLRARELLERTERLTPEELMRLHGVMRRRPSRLGPGDRVRLRPRARADIFDMVLAGKTATIQAIEQDFEDRIFFSVTIDDDPGSDLGELGQPGHRFFYRPDEVEPLD